MIKDERMKALYDVVRGGVTVCDVGTDHAHIPIELILSGKSPKCIITDISAPSLQKGVKNAENASCGERITAYCTNGTLDVPLEREMDFIIAGMGGELIAQIIGQDKRLSNPAYRFALQPMSRAEELRAFLSQNGFEMLSETKVESMGRIYPVINAVYTGQPYTPTDTVMLLGFEKAKTELEKRFALKCAEQLEYKLKGINSADNPDTAQSEKVQNQIKAIKKSMI